MPTLKKYSLWLRPFGDVAYSLKQRIHKLSEKYGSPSFEPHVTLLGGLTNSEIELVQLTNTLASCLNPFDIVLTKTGSRNSYFQSLFIHVRESSELINARKTAEQLFDHGFGEKYMPHLSLMYGDFTREEKERILNTIGREFYLRFTVDRLFLIQTQGEPDKWKKSCSVEFSKIS